MALTTITMISASGHRGIKTATITRITYEVAVCGDNGNDFTMIREVLTENYVIVYAYFDCL